MTRPTPPAGRQRGGIASLATACLSLVLVASLVVQPLCLQQAAGQDTHRESSCCCGPASCAFACEGCSSSEPVPPPSPATQPATPAPPTADAAPAVLPTSDLAVAFAPRPASLEDTAPRGRPPSSLLLNAVFLC